MNRQSSRSPRPPPNNNTNVFQLLQSHEARVRALESASGSKNGSEISAKDVDRIETALQRCSMRLSKSEQQIKAIHETLRGCLSRTTDIELVVDSISKQTGGTTELGTVRVLLGAMKEDIAIMKENSQSNYNVLNKMSCKEREEDFKKAVSEISRSNIDVIKALLAGVPASTPSEDDQASENEAAIDLDSEIVSSEGDEQKDAAEDNIEIDLEAVPVASDADEDEKVKIREEVGEEVAHMSASE